MIQPKRAVIDRPYRRHLLLRVRLDVVHHEALQSRVRQTQTFRFRARFIEIPFVHENAFHEPHSRGAVSAGAMNECRLVAELSNRLEELVDDSRARFGIIEWNVEELYSSGFCRGGFALDVSSLFCRLPEVDDGNETHFL